MPSRRVPRPGLRRAALVPRATFCGQFATLAAAAAIAALLRPPTASAAAAPPRTQVLVTPAGPVAAARRALRAAGATVQLRRGRTLQALVPTPALARVRADPAVSTVSRATTGVADAVVSLGVTRIGAELLQRAGDVGAGVRIAVLDQAFGDVARLDDLAGSELPPLDRQTRRAFDRTYGLTGRDFFGEASRHGEMLAEVLYDLAPAATYLYVSYRTPLELDQAVDWLVQTGHPDIVVHANSFLSGPFDGTGWYAQRVDRAAAAGILWVNSAGNYRTRHWEGPWADADGDGALDVPAHGEAIPLQLGADARPACELSWPGADPTGAAGGYALGLFQDAEGNVPAIDDTTGTPIRSQLVSFPEPHAELGPARVSLPGTYYLRVTRLGGPSTERLTLFCRQELPADVQVHGSSLPTPGDARGALTVGAYDAASFAGQAYSSEGPTDDGRLKPDVTAPTNVTATGRETITGTSAATPHAAGAAALLWGRLAAESPTDVAARVADRLRATAADADAPGPDPVSGFGRVRLDTSAPAFRQASLRAGAAISQPVPVRLPLASDGPIESVVATVDGVPVPLALGPDLVASGRLNPAALADGPHVLQARATDPVGNASVLSVPFTVDRTPPAVSVQSAGDVLAGQRLVVRVRARDALTGVAGRPAVRFGDGAQAAGSRVTHRFLAAGRRTLVVAVGDRAGNVRSVRRSVRVDEFRLATARGGRRVSVTLGRRERVVLEVRRGRRVVVGVDRLLGAGTHAVSLARLPRGPYRLSVRVRRAAFAQRLLLGRRTPAARG